ncbi:helix-turn-helix domain-containing protein [Rhodobaculum claviforme]|uniref:Transcriptional regulator n=1 Tax=Rhodobaculum claviforme TaxID=1549854 RepID=A0A934TLF6_9RHOB|nr:helix-turn-helix transcriptional regulator [Rhodobaculum claviforme]MBK5927985.1 transcriptional regulator [Rhodobaculum claviforme]
MSTTRPGRPYADTRLAQFLELRILQLKPKKTQAEIAAEAGLRSINFLTMLKQGSSKVPLDRVPALAKALEVDPKHMFKLALEQELGGTSAQTVEDIFGTIVTRNEVAWLEAIREASDHSDPTLTSRVKATLRGIFGR